MCYSWGIRHNCFHNGGCGCKCVRRLWASGVHEPEEMADRLNARGYLYTLRELKLPAAPAAILVKQRRTPVIDAPQATTLKTLASYSTS
jgi:hypothetical protein